MAGPIEVPRGEGAQLGGVRTFAGSLMLVISTSIEKLPADVAVAACAPTFEDTR